MPKVQEEVKKLFGKEPHKGVNPDEVVAVGAAVQAAVLTGEVKDLLLLDVTPLSLGIETLGGVMTQLIDANTTIPTKKAEVFTTAADSQPSVEVHVLQGERPMARDNRTLGRFHLDGIPPAPRGVPQIEVTFDIDANGILNVSAQDKATGKQQNITITASSGLSKDEIERMMKEAEAQRGRGRRAQREEIEVRNHADSLVYSTERTLGEHGDKVGGRPTRQAIEAALSEVREALKTEDLERIKQAQEALTAGVAQAGRGHVPRGPGQGPARSAGGARAGARRAATEGRRGRRRVRGSGREEVTRARGRRGTSRGPAHDHARLLRGARESRRATAAQIRRAYQRLARQYSPDVNFWEQRRAGALRGDRRGVPRARRSRPRARSTTAGRAGSAGRPGATSEPAPPGRRGDDLHVAGRAGVPQAVSGVEADVPVERLSPCETCARPARRRRVPAPC